MCGFDLDFCDTQLTKQEKEKKKVYNRPKTKMNTPLPISESEIMKTVEQLPDRLQTILNNRERKWFPPGFQPFVGSVICGKGKESKIHRKRMIV